MAVELRPFQRRFIKAATRPAVDTAALSLSRGNGKSWLAGHVLARALTPGDPLHVSGAEYLLCAASLDQARIVFRFVRAELEPRGGYRFTDSGQRLGVTGPGDTRLRVLSSNAKGAFGIVGCPLAVCDEPGAWEVTRGEMMADALQTALGKPGSRLRLLFIDTLAPARGGWWHDLIRGGSHGSTIVQALQGDPAKWGYWPEIRRVNPLTAISPEFRRKLLDERDAARRDERLKARFLSYRLNRPTRDASDVLLTVAEWETVAARPEGLPLGRPVVGVDMGGGRSWSAACAIWPETCRVEAFAVAPGIPSLAETEKRDRVPAGAFGRLAADGALHVAAGLHVPPAGQIADRVLEWSPAVILCDRFRYGELQDAIRGRVPMVPRVGQWSESSEDIRTLRQLALDGGLNVAPYARRLIERSIGEATVEPDTSGNLKLTKLQWRSGSDDVAVALALACGEVGRLLRRPRMPLRIHRAS